MWINSPIVVTPASCVKNLGDEVGTVVVPIAELWIKMFFFVSFIWRGGPF